MKDSQRSWDLADEWVERQLARDASEQHRLALSAGEIAHLKSYAAVVDLIAECDKDAS